MKQAKAWRYRLEYVGFRLAEALAHVGSLETVSAASGAIWRRLGPLTRRHRRAVSQLARAFPELSSAEVQSIALEMWETLGRTFAETFRLKEIAESDRITIENYDYWRRKAETPGGWIVCSAHFGNWEIAAAALRDAGRPVAGIYQKMSNPLVERRLRAMRDFLYPAGLFPKDPSLGTQILKTIRNGAALAILADQRDNRGVMAPFFGRPAPTLPFPALLARKTGTPLFVGSLLRKPGVRFELRVTEIEVPQTQDIDADVRVATEALQKRLELWIREAPGQWMWTHRRWG